MTVNIGDIILVEYRDFNNEAQLGMFFVYSKDNYYLSNLKSFSTLKICTKPLSYQIFLDSKYYKFLNHDSYINCGCQQRFHEKQVKQILGTVNSYTLEKVQVQLNQFNKDVNMQLDNAISHYRRLTKSYSVNQNNKYQNNSNK